MTNLTNGEPTKTEPQDESGASTAPSQEVATSTVEATSRRRRFRWGVGLTVGILVVGIGVGVFVLGNFGAAPQDEADDAAAPQDKAVGSLLVTAQGSLIQEDGGQTEFCTVTTASMPPQCIDGIPVAGVNMAELPYAETQPGRIAWAGVRVTGRWDGETLTVTETARPSPPWNEEESGGLSPACEPPPGGWEDSPIKFETEPSSQADVNYFGGTAELDAYINQHRDVFGGTWPDPTHTVRSILFTDDVDAHEAAIREFYAGQLCVAEADHSMAELEAVAEQIEADKMELRSEGAYVFRTWLGPPFDRLDVETVVADDTAVAVMEDRYGDAVHVEGWLEVIE